MVHLSQFFAGSLTGKAGKLVETCKIGVDEIVSFDTNYK
jgi:hypothetical protein